MADTRLRLLEQTTWQQEVGHGRPFPRLTAWYADRGLVYRYSGVTTAAPAERRHCGSHVPCNAASISFPA